MDYPQSDYGYIADLGLFFIPNIMRKESMIKESKDNQVTLVECGISDGHITLKHHKTVSRDEFKAMQDNKPKEIRVIDEFGRVALPKVHLDELKISPQDALVTYLLNDGTIKIRPLVVSRTFASDAD